MGIGIFKVSGCSCDKKDTMPTSNINPDPFRFNIISCDRIGDYIVARINYKGVITFEGEKILVFKGLSTQEFLDLESIDPHFCNTGHASPIARFIPTLEGYKMALNFCRTLNNQTTEG